MKIQQEKTWGSNCSFMSGSDGSSVPPLKNRESKKERKKERKNIDRISNNFEEFFSNFIFLNFLGERNLRPLASKGWQGQD